MRSCEKISEDAIKSKDVEKLTSALKATLGALDTGISGMTSLATSLAAQKGDELTPNQPL